MLNRQIHRRGETQFYALIVLSVIATWGVVRTHAQDCGPEEFAKCAQPLDMLQLTPDFSIGAAEKEEFKKLCAELDKGVECIKSYTRRCMNQEQRTQFYKLYRGTNQFIRDLCKAGAFQDEYLKHAPCTQMAKRESEECAERYKETMVFLSQNKNPEAEANETFNENVKTICCSISELVDCSESAARKVCGNEAAKFTRELVNKYANSLTKMYCDDFSRHYRQCPGNGSDRVNSRISFWFSIIFSLFVVLTGSRMLPS